jgi:hypothetical protein
LKSRKTALQGQNRTRHEAVLQLMRLTYRRCHRDTREEMALQVAKCFGKGQYFSRKLLQWERAWIRDQHIEEGRQGCFSKVSSWLNDEGVQLAVREYFAGTKDCEILPMLPFVSFSF